MYKETRELTKECWDLFKAHDNYISQILERQKNTCVDFIRRLIDIYNH